jgi:hypothetical protein
MKKVLFAAVAVLVFTGISFAATPLKLSLWNKVAVPPGDAVYGLEFGIGSYTPEIKGVALNLLYGKTDDVVGAQFAFVNFSQTFLGFEHGAANLNSAHISGVQLGFFNKSKSVKGLQLGVVNMTEDMQGIQIGIANFIKNSTLPFMVIVNAKF